MLKYKIPQIVTLIREKHIDLPLELHQSGRYLRRIRHKTNPRFTMSHRKTGILLSS